jgi:sugar phosphate isomerase/epimerase
VRVEKHGSSFQLTYCTNIHAADGWDAVYANVRQYALAIKRRVAPDSSFGIGLRLSARDARELLAGERLAEFRHFLDDNGLYVALINGFPHGSFHRTVVKADVYAPDWAHDERLRYTLDLVEILERLVPQDLDGGISTAPLTYKTWMPADPEPAWRAFTENVVRVAEAMVRVRERSGRLIHLDIEPEPDCLIETTGEFVDFFERRLLAHGAAPLAANLGCNRARAEDYLREHVRVCLDCCHYAVEFEDPEEALRRFRSAGIRIGRVQVSSALKAIFPEDSRDRDALVQRLRRFADSTYLHQVVQACDGLTHYPDLDVALEHAGAVAAWAEWRIHFHVPLFATEYDGLESTQDYARKVIDLVTASGDTRHFELETYTWDVLPEELRSKLDLLGSIVREFYWAIDVFTRNAE